MSCTPPIRTVRSQTEVVFSKGGAAGTSASDVFVLSPDGMIQIAPLVEQLRVTIIVDHVTGATGDCLTQAVLQATDDGITWGAAVGLEAAPVAGNRSFTTDWHTSAANFRRGLRLGVVASQGNAVTNVVMCRVTFIIDLQMKA